MINKATLFKIAACIIGLSVVLNARQAIAQAETVDQRRVYIARDVCNAAAKFVDPSQGGNISYQAGQFSVQGAHGSITIYEGDTKITEIPGFTYNGYTDCINRIYATLDRERKAQD